MIRAPTSLAGSARGPPWKAAPQVSSSSFLGRQPGIGAIAELLYGVAGEGLAPPAPPDSMPRRSLAFQLTTRSAFADPARAGPD